jgi:hypothetical protein
VCPSYRAVLITAFFEKDLDFEKNTKGAKAGKKEKRKKAGIRREKVFFHGTIGVKNTQAGVKQGKEKKQGLSRAKGKSSDKQEPRKKSSGQGGEQKKQWLSRRTKKSRG